jgi:hypothetical protein
MALTQRIGYRHLRWSKEAWVMASRLAMVILSIIVTAAAAVSARAGSAILYVEPPSSPIVTTAGTVSWSFAEDGPGGAGVRAKVRVPDRAIAFDIDIFRNEDTSLPALLIVEVRTGLSAVAKIPRVAAKAVENTTGQALLGAAAKVSDGVFWIALSNVGADATTNLSLLNSAQWIDLPFLLEDGRRAILTFEKDADGEVAFRQALAVWNYPVAHLAEFVGNRCDVLMARGADAGISVSVCRGNFRGEEMALVRVAGQMAPGDDVRFGEAVRTISEQRVVIALSGPGGNLEAGLGIGKLIRERGFETLATPRELCLSMCALAWLSGNQRHAANSSYIGFHAPWHGDADQREVSAVGSALVGAYLKELGLSDAAIVFVTGADPDDLRFLSFQKAKELGIQIAHTGQAD